MIKTHLGQIWGIRDDFDHCTLHDTRSVIIVSTLIKRSDRSIHFESLERIEKNKSSIERF